MSPIGPKLPRLRLDPVSYESLRQQILRRDGWRCQSCGAMSNLEVHHKPFRSHSGHDSEENLITMCTACHATAHRGGDTDRAEARRKDCLFKTKRGRLGKTQPLTRRPEWSIPVILQAFLIGPDCSEAVFLSTDQKLRDAVLLCGFDGKQM